MATYNSIPSNLMVPGFYAEFDPSRANTGAMQHKLLILGQRLASGSVAAAQPIRVSRASEAPQFFGPGSQLSEMLIAALNAKPTMDVWAIALDDLGAGNAAAANFVLAGAASVAGTLRVELGNTNVRVGVTVGMASADLAAAIVAAINARTDMPAVAAVNGSNASRVDLTTRNKGLGGNDIPVRIRFEVAAQPTAPTIAITPFAGGTGNPDIGDAIAAMGDEWYRWIITPWTDTPNLIALETELADRFSALRAIGCRAVTAFRGTYGQTAAFGNTRNSPHVSCIGTGLSQTPPHIWAAVNGVAAANSLMNDPSQQLTTLPLPGIAPPLPADRFTFTERNNLAYEGISTYTVDAGGVVRIENQLTMYQVDAQGNADTSMLHINVPELYEEYRRQQKLLFAPHARDKLADDGNNLPVGQPIMTPKKARGMLYQFYSDMISVRGWCENLAPYKESLVCEKVGDRLLIVDQPDFINNLRQIFARSELVG